MMEEERSWMTPATASTTILHNALCWFELAARTFYINAWILSTALTYKSNYLRIMLWKLVLLLIVTLSIGIPGSLAQQSDVSIERIARKDALRNFQLNEHDFKKFRLNRRNRSGSYFNPDTSTVSNPAFLSDSVYVQTFRYFAYLKTRGRRTVGHYALWGGAVFVTGAGILALMVSNLEFDWELK